MVRRSWKLSGGLELPEPDVPIYMPTELLEAGKHPGTQFRRERPPSEVSRRALETYEGAADNADSLLDEAGILASEGRHARAFALACTALEEIGKSQYAADAYTGFVPPDEFEKNHPQA